MVDGPSLTFEHEPLGRVVVWDAEELPVAVEALPCTPRRLAHD